MKKLLIVLCLLLLLAAAGWFSGIWFSRFSAETRYQIPEKVVVPEKGKTGEVIPVAFVVTTPRSDEVAAVSVSAGEGSVAGKVAITRQSHFLATENRVAFSLLPTRSGKVSGGKVDLTFARGKKIQIALPSFETMPGESNAEQKIQLAGVYLEPAAHWWMWGVAAIVLLLIAGIVARFWRRRRKRRKKSFYEHILSEIAAVRRDSATPEAGVARLTDLVRRYLDHRFNCAVESASTWEFLRKLEQKESLLPAEIHPFLREFLRYADVVKFARADADWAQLADAAERAASLVRSTMPQEKEAKRV